MLKAIRIISVILLVACMIFIFCMSAENSEKSSDTSGNIIITMLKIVYRDFDQLSAIEKEELVSSMQFFVRKGAHFTIYAIMGVLAFYSVGTYPIPLGLKITFGALICLLYSISDEIHQRFVPGRSGEVRDVCLDFSGSILAIIFISILVKSGKFRFYNKYFKGVNGLRKKKLLELNHELFNNLESVKAAAKELRQENISLRKELANLSREYEELKNSSISPEEPLLPEMADEKPLPQKSINLPPLTDYAASVIGKIVVNAAKCCNSLSADKGNSDTKELINLILGRTEVSKAEILKILSSENEDSAKTTLINAENTAAEDYFRSVMAQI